VLINYNSLLILGATASGKTKLAAQLANDFDGEIISADSRQVYTQLILGAGKDYDEYIIEGKQIKHHLIDVASIDKTFYLKDFVTLAKDAFSEIASNKKLPIICGGTGLYLDALLKNLERIFIPENDALRLLLQEKSNEELLLCLKQFGNIHAYNFDVNSRKRLIRAIEILKFNSTNIPSKLENNLHIKPLIIGLQSDVNNRREKISIRLEQRLKRGLIEEVENLLLIGYTKEQLVFLGLEYKFITHYLLGEKTYDEMYKQLETAIHQFAKRQATWFRKMEREGLKINWIDVGDDFENILNTASQIIHNQIN